MVRKSNRYICANTCIVCVKFHVMDEAIFKNYEIKCECFHLKGEEFYWDKKIGSVTIGVYSFIKTWLWRRENTRRGGWERGKKQRLRFQGFFDIGIPRLQVDFHESHIKTRRDILKFTSMNDIILFITILLSLFMDKNNQISRGNGLSLY